MYLNNMINRVKCAVRFSLVSLTAMPVEKGGVALMQSTVDDLGHYDWLTDIQLHKSVHLGEVM